MFGTDLSKKPATYLYGNYQGKYNMETMFHLFKKKVIYSP